MKNQLNSAEAATCSCGNPTCSCTPCTCAICTCGMSCPVDGCGCGTKC